jgi:hypothetical protein
MEVLTVRIEYTGRGKSKPEMVETTESLPGPMSVCVCPFCLDFVRLEAGEFPSHALCRCGSWSARVVP